MSKKATLQQVAAYAGVSIATASRTFSQPDLVKPVTLEKIRAAALALNYKAPSVLERDRTMLRIAVFARLFSNSGDLERLRGISIALRAWPHESLFYDVDENFSSMEYVKTLVVTKRIDSLILMGVPVSESVASYLLKFQIPTVLIDVDDSRFSRVLTSDEKGGALVADLINKSKYQKILVVGEHPSRFTMSGGLRIKAFRDRLDRKSKSIIGELLIDTTSEAGQKELIAALKSKNCPDVVFASSDLLAVEVIKSCMQLGILVPADLSIIGYGDLDVAAQLGVSTVRTHLDASGRRSVEILRSSGAEIIREVLIPELVLRQSTGKM